MSGLLNAKEYDGLGIYKECKTPKSPKKDAVRKAVRNETKRKTKNEMAG